MGELVSVIIPNYNKEKYLEQCVNSVLVQTYPCIESVIVDDLSTDRSREIIAELQKQHDNIKPILLDKNGGVSHARNVGIQAASGMYVTMLDSDDYYYSIHKISNEMAMLEKNSEDGIAYSYRQIVDENGNVLYPEVLFPERYRSGNLYMVLLTEKDACNFVQRDYIVKKEYILSVGAYTEGMSYYEDFDLLLRLTRNHSMYCTGTDGTAYRMVQSGLSHSQMIDNSRQFWVPQKIRLKYIRKLSGWKRISLFLQWIIECIRLQIMIILRKVKRIIC